MGTKSQTVYIWTSIVYLLDNLSFFQKTYESCREIQNASKSTISEIIRKPTIVVSLLCQFFFGDYLKKEQRKIKTKKTKKKQKKKAKTNNQNHEVSRLLSLNWPIEWPEEILVDLNDSIFIYRGCGPLRSRREDGL